TPAFPSTTSWRWCISFTTNTTFVPGPPSASSGRPSSIVTSRVFTAKLAPLCNSVPNATRHQGSHSLKHSLIRQHKTQGGNENERSSPHSEGSIRSKGIWDTRKVNNH